MEGFIEMVRDIKIIKRTNLMDTLDYIAQELGHERWDQLRNDPHHNMRDYRQIKGPYAVVLLKALAAKHRASTTR